MINEQENYTEKKGYIVGQYSGDEQTIDWMRVEDKDSDELDIFETRQEALNVFEKEMKKRFESAEKRGDTRFKGEDADYVNVVIRAIRMYTPKTLQKGEKMDKKMVLVDREDMRSGVSADEFQRKMEGGNSIFTDDRAGDVLYGDDILWD